MAAKKKDADLTELERVQKQWTKLSGLHTRDEWSAAIVRAATAAELMANIAIRSEFTERSEFDEKFVNSMLMWANGLNGKLTKLLLPLSDSDDEKKKAISPLRKLAETVNAKRNAIAHQGKFSTKTEALQVIDDARAFITGLALIYEPEFVLEEKASARKKRQG